MVASIRTNERCESDDLYIAEDAERDGLRLPEKEQEAIMNRDDR